MNWIYQVSLDLQLVLVMLPVFSVSYDDSTHIMHNVTCSGSHYIYSLYAGIDDFSKVNMSLRNVSDWQSLGLELGLLYPRLARIEKEQCGWIDECKREMLAAWLKQEDNVNQYGVPSWSTLQTALRNIGENKLVSEIN